MKTYKSMKKSKKDIPIVKGSDIKADKFARNYVKTLNAEKSYQIATGGKNQKSNNANGSRYLKRPDVQEAVSKYAKKVLDDEDITARRVIHETGCIAFSNIQRCMNEDGSWKSPTELDEQTARAIKGFMPDGSPIFWNKNDALQLLFKRFGLLTMKTEITGANGGVIKIQWGGDDGNSSNSSENTENSVPDIPEE